MHLALHDPLTGLANRYLLLDYLRRVLLQFRTRGGSIALVFVLLIALDYPFRGDVSVSDEAFVNVKTTMGAGHAADEEKPKPH